MKGKRKEKEEEDGYEVVKITRINDYLEQGKEKMLGVKVVKIGIQFIKSYDFTS